MAHQSFVGDQQPSVGKPPDRVAQAWWLLSHDLGAAVEADGDDLGRPPVGKPEASFVPAGRFDHGELVQQHPRRDIRACHGSSSCPYTNETTADRQRRPKKSKEEKEISSPSAAPS